MKKMPEFHTRPAFLREQPVKVKPLSCHCKLKSLVPLLNQLLQEPKRPLPGDLPKIQMPPQAPLTLGFTHP
ncbi:hypothetical protein BH24BAC1_BH24BAC1_27910 [soil metagenome]